MQPIFACFTENLNYAIGWTVIHSLWQATLLAIIAAIVAIIGRKKSPQLRYWIYNATLLSVFVAAIVTFCVYFDFSKEVGQTVFIPEGINVLANTEGLAQTEIRNPISEIGSPLPNLSGSAISIDGLTMYFNRNIYLIVTIWVLGVALFILKLLGGISYVYYLRSKLNFPADEYWLEMVEKLGEKAGVKRSMELVESALVRSPLVVGHLKPMILFPIGAINKLNPQEVEAILAHEIAHILRNDYVFNIVQSVIEALFYFHPAVWWISANIRAERENCCDDVAIALCGNSMTYAKSLVSLQEMAFYGSPQSRELGMAFAGTQKNQLLFRIQRILKQPKNKTNIMEKLTATTALLFLMIALSFGGNRWKNSPFLVKNDVNNTPSVSEAALDGTNGAVGKKSIFYMKYTVNGMLDSFPVSKKVADGDYNYVDNKFRATLTVKNHAVVRLAINGTNIPADEIKNHYGFINLIINKESTTPQYEEQVDLVEPTDPPTPPYPPMPMPSVNESNGDMVMSNPDGSQTTISHKSEGGDNAQVVTTRQKDGSYTVTRSGKNGTISETFDRFGKKITSNTIGRFANQNPMSGERTYIGKDDNTVTSYDKNGIKSVITLDKDGGQLIKIYKNETELLHTLKIINGRYFIDGRAATESELRAFGFERRGNGLQKIGGYMNIQPDKNSSNKAISTTTSSKISTTVSSNDDTDDEDPAEKYEEIKEEIENLKEEIKECECTTNKNFRNKLVMRLDNLKVVLNKKLSLSELQKIESQYDMIHQEWETGECEDNNNKQTPSRNTGNGASIGYGNSYSGAETARKAAETASRDAERARRTAATLKNKSEKPDMMQVFFLDLVTRGLIAPNVSNRVEFDNSRLKINGRVMDNATFQSVKNNFEKNLKNKNSPYTIAYSGIIRNVTDTGLSIQGTLSTSLNDN